MDPLFMRTARAVFQSVGGIHTAIKTVKTLPLTLAEVVRDTPSALDGIWMALLVAVSSGTQSHCSTILVSWS